MTVLRGSKAKPLTSSEQAFIRRMQGYRGTPTFRVSRPVQHGFQVYEGPRTSTADEQARALLRDLSPKKEGQ